MGRTFKQVDETERRLVKNMRKEKLTWEVIQRITGRSPDTLSSIIKNGLSKSVHLIDLNYGTDRPGSPLFSSIEDTAHLSHSMRERRNCYNHMRFVGNYERTQSEGESNSAARTHTQTK